MVEPSRNLEASFLEAAYNMQRGCLDYIDDLLEQLAKLQEADPVQRVVGAVAYATRFGLEKHYNFRDWALVQMAADPHHYENKVYMAEPVTKATMLRAANITAVGLQGTRLQYVDPVNNLNENGFLRLHGRDLPLQPPFETEDRIPVLVAKRGQRSGLSFGITNEIEAVQRTPYTEDGSPAISLHWLVLDIKEGHFSTWGDSGSCVFDMTGRVLGILDAGVVGTNFVPEGSAPLTASALMGVTFVTPIQWVLEGIRDLTGCEPQIL